MSIIRFTEADRLAGTTMEKGGYTFQITEIDGPRASQSQRSINYFVTIRCTEGKYINKELTLLFNTEMRERSLMGTQQFFPTRDFMLISAAQQSKKLDEISLDIDPEDLKNVSFDAMVDAVTADG